MSWNYRVIRRVYKNLLGEEEEDYSIHETYYDANNEPNAITVKPISVSADDVDGLRWILKKMSEAVEKPVLDYDKIGTKDK